jgi:hypothetical protein
MQQTRGLRNIQLLGQTVDYYPVPRLDIYTSWWCLG